MLKVVLELALMLLRILREILGLARDIKQPRRHDQWEAGYTVLLRPPSCWRPFLFTLLPWSQRKSNIDMTGQREAYIRLGDENIVAPDHTSWTYPRWNESFDSLVSKYDAKDFAFSSLRARYRKWTGKSFDNSFLVSFGLVEEGTDKLTNAVVLIANDCPLRQSRVFYVRWNGLTKASVLLLLFPVLCNSQESELWKNHWKSGVYFEKPSY